ncbi:hypothetical protein Ddc_17259 [Ditylenchus destructor]|nr:hypothetical protein Ddc_17259 [Ditylenchus destructor]
MGKRKNSKAVGKYVSAKKKINESLAQEYVPSEKNSPVEQVSDDVLVLISQKLHFIDRLNAELVSRRWQMVVKTKGWTEFHKFSWQDLKFYSMATPHPKPRPYRMVTINWKNSERFAYQIRQKQFEAIFNRVSNSLRELNLDWFVTVNAIGKLIPEMLPNLVHLNLGNTVQPSSSDFRCIANKLPNLRSFAFENPNVGPGLNYFLANASHLEYLSICRCKNFQIRIRENIRHPNHPRITPTFTFESLPPNLKYLRFDTTTFPSHLLQTAYEYCPKLASIECMPDPDKVELTFLDELQKFHNLQYLSIVLHQNQNDAFAQCITNLTNLRALDLQIFSQADTVIDCISQYLHKLEHFGLSTNPFTVQKISMNKARDLAGLPKLVSLFFNEKREEDQIQFNDMLLREMTSKRNLEFFSVCYGNIPLISVRDALCKCKTLRGMAWQRISPFEIMAINVPFSNSSMHQIADILDDIHGKNTTPENFDDIFQIYSGISVPAGFSHPWLKISDKPFKSPVGERIRFGCLKSKP